jgi:hypothetical protein
MNGLRKVRDSPVGSLESRAAARVLIGQRRSKQTRIQFVHGIPRLGVAKAGNLPTFRKQIPGLKARMGSYSVWFTFLTFGLLEKKLFRYGVSQTLGPLAADKSVPDTVAVMCE